MPVKSPELSLNPNVLRWARERAGLSANLLAEKMKVSARTIAAWEENGLIPVSKAEEIARRTHTPFGYLYLHSPPDDSLPIADFRTRADAPPERPSPDLLETVFQMQRRQMWLSEELAYQQADPLDFVGSYDLRDSVHEVASAIRRELQLEKGWASVEGSWIEALQKLREYVESLGILVVINGVVGNDTHRALDPDEFQGFSLVDDLAPLIFVNNADYKTAQIFTLAHEVAHIFLGQQGVSRIAELYASDHHVERICDLVAAEFLVPEDQFKPLWIRTTPARDSFEILAKHFKVSTIVIARRAADTNLIDREEYRAFFAEHKTRDWGGQRQGGSTGGDFWNNQNGRIGKRFAVAVLNALGEGRLSYRDAYGLTGLSGKTFDNMPAEMGLIQ